METGCILYKRETGCLELHNVQYVATNLLHGAESVLRRLPRNSAHFMEPEDSLPHLQVPAICPYIEPDQSNPSPSLYFLKSILILTSQVCLGILSDLFPSGFPTKTCIHPSSPICVPHAQPITIFPYWITRIKSGEDCRSLSSSLCSLLHLLLPRTS